MNLDLSGFPPMPRITPDAVLTAAVAEFNDGRPWPDGSLLWNDPERRLWVSLDLDDGDPREPYVQITLYGADCQQRAADVLKALREAPDA